jgi:putative Mg2+ transporter-C (MgtC) family protein
MTITNSPFTLRLSSALLLGALVGLERQWRQRMAGTRTNALVAAGAAAFVMCGLLLAKSRPLAGLSLSRTWSKPM